MMLFQTKTYDCYILGFNGFSHILKNCHFIVCDHFRLMLILKKSVFLKITFHLSTKHQYMARACSDSQQVTVSSLLAGIKLELTDIYRQKNYTFRVGAVMPKRLVKYIQWLFEKTYCRLLFVVTISQSVHSFPYKM